MDTLVKIRDLHKVYRRGQEQIDVLQGVTLDIPQGDFLALMGPSGSGKTTLLNLIGGLDTPSGGSIDVGGDRIDTMSGGKLTTWRARHIGFIFQMYNLLPVLTAARNVELPLLLTKLSSADRKKRVLTALSVVGLADRAQHYPRQLSGGQEQRVGIARAIVTDPTLLLCDEPTGDLDRKSGDEVLNLLQTLNKDLGKTIVMVTHDPQAAARAKRTLHLEKGLLVEEVVQRMKALHLVWRNLLRRKIRTIITLLAIIVGFILFGATMAIRAAFGMGVEVAGADRLMTIHKVSLINLLPKSYLERIRSIEGVKEVSHANWFGAYYQDPSNFLTNMAVDPGELAPDVPGVRRPRGSEEGLVRRSDRRGHRERSREALQLEGRGSRPAHLADLPEARRLAVGPRHRAASTTRPSRARTRPSCSSTGTTSTRRSGSSVGIADQVGWYVIKVSDPATSDQLAKTSGRALRELIGRDEDRDGEGIRLGLREAGRRHRRDHDRRGGGRHGPHPARHRQHDGAVDPGADERAGDPEDARIQRRPNPRAWCCSSRAPSRSSAAVSAWRSRGS